MFVRTPLASAIAVTLGLSTAGMGVAQADDSLFFPYVALSDTVTTIVSVINTSQRNWSDTYFNTDATAQAPAGNLHYRLYYKTGSALNDPLAACNEIDYYLPTSPWDLQTSDLGGVYGSDTMGVLFNDPSIRNNWRAKATYPYSIGQFVRPARGYLYVDNADGIINAGPDGIKSLSGEAFMFEFGSGAAWGYLPYNNDAGFVGGGRMTGMGPGNAPAVRSHDYRWAATKNPYPVAFMPLAETTTVFFVTPVSIDQAPDRPNSYRGRIQFVNAANQRRDIYNRDEVPISGAIAADVVCVGRVPVTSLMTDAMRDPLQNGGWGYLQNFRTDAAGNPVVFNSGHPTPNTIVRSASNIASNQGTGELIDSDFLGSIDASNPSAPLWIQNEYRNADVNRITNDRRAAGNVVIKLEYNTGGQFNGESVGGIFNNGYVLPTERERQPFDR